VHVRAGKCERTGPDNDRAGKSVIAGERQRAGARLVHVVGRAVQRSGHGRSRAGRDSDNRRGIEGQPVPPLTVREPCSKVSPPTFAIVPLTVMVDAPVALAPAEKNSDLATAPANAFHVDVARPPAESVVQFAVVAASHVPAAVVPPLGTCRWHHSYPINIRLSLQGAGANPHGECGSAAPTRIALVAFFKAGARRWRNKYMRVE